jgi:hypothetical protein
VGAAVHALLASIEARRLLAVREINVLDELRQVAARGLIEGTLTFADGDAGLPVTGAMDIFSGQAVACTCARSSNPASSGR